EFSPPSTTSCEAPSMLIARRRERSATLSSNGSQMPLCAIGRQRTAAAKTTATRGLYLPERIPSALAAAAFGPASAWAEGARSGGGDGAGSPDGSAAGGPAAGGSEPAGVPTTGASAAAGGSSRSEEASAAGDS